jgi:hypothetical protein
MSPSWSFSGLVRLFPISSPEGKRTLNIDLTQIGDSELSQTIKGYIAGAPDRCDFATRLSKAVGCR